MPTEENKSSDSSLRAAVEKTFAAAAAEPRGRAQDLLGDISRIGQGRREDLSRRSQEAREASSAAAARLVDTVERIRLTGREEVREVEDRVADLEAHLKRLSERVEALESNPKAEG
ncbi:MAG TPA: hypothetical protein VFD37_06320 [Solirubrobacterales bacterium]|nr:hypothetical protein [Solirubrobacterales bacterium]